MKELIDIYYCHECHEIAVDQDGKICQKCQDEHQSGYHIARLAGRCANGAERDSGTLYHAIQLGDYKAMCSAEPGRRSAGWSPYHGDNVTCPRCLRILQNKTRNDVESDQP